jgi:hypothetical protein
MKAHKLEVLVIDFEGYGPQEFATIIEQHRHINGSVMATTTADIGEWSDDHPLNKGSTIKAEYVRLFPAAQQAAHPAASAGVEPALPDPTYIYHASDVEGEDNLHLFAESGAVDEGCEHCVRLYTEQQVRELLASRAPKGAVWRDPDSGREVAKPGALDAATAAKALGLSRAAGVEARMPLSEERIDLWARTFLPPNAHGAREFARALEQACAKEWGINLSSEKEGGNG